MFRILLPLNLLLCGLFQAPIVADEPLVVDLGQGVSIELVRIPKGEFLQGSPETEQGRETDEVARKVVLSKDFYLGTTPVTVDQFRRFVAETGYKTEAESGPSGGFGVVGGELVQQPQFNWKNPGYQQTDEHPVTIVTFADAAAFLQWLNGKAGRNMVLPSEAQWEYSCRAGSSCRFYNRNDDSAMDAIGWSQTNSSSSPMPVKQKQANALGLCDMSGNVYEWCQDTYDLYSSEAVTDPLQVQGQPGEKSRNVLRGGSWMRLPKRCRSAARYRATPGTRNAENGFRVATMDLQTIVAATDVTTGTQAADNAAAPAMGFGPNADDTNPTEFQQDWTPMQPEGPSYGGVFFFFATVAMIIFGWIRYQFSRAGAGREIKLGKSATRAGNRKPGGADGFALGMMSGVLQAEKDGFWLSTAIYPMGTMLQYEYWSDGTLFSETVEVTSPEKQFVYTGSAPTDIKVRVSDSVTRPGDPNTAYPTETWTYETEQSSPRSAPQTYVFGNPLAHGKLPSDRLRDDRPPETTSGRSVGFPPAY